MFDGLVVAASRTGGVGAWARVENAACARRLAAMVDILERRLAADGSADREQWILDNWEGVAAEVAAAQNTSLGVAAHQLALAEALRTDLPRVAEVFAAGQISLRMVNTIVYRTALITDRDAAAKVDVEIAAACAGWGALSVAKLESAIDFWVDRYDPHTLRRIEDSARGRYVEVKPAGSANGSARVEAILFAHDAEALDERLDAMAGAMCAEDPRTVEQRRADALGALGHGGQRLACGCDNPDCDAAGAAPSAVVLHVVTNQESLADDSPVRLDGAEQPAQPSGAQPAVHEPSPEQPAAASPDEPGVDEPAAASGAEPEVLARPAPAATAPSGSAASAPALIMGGALLPAPVLAAKVAAGARIVPIIHPGQAPPEPRYRPSKALADFVRARDLTCREPGCDVPADHRAPWPTQPPFRSRTGPPRPPTSNACADKATSARRSAGGKTNNSPTARMGGRPREKVS